jgi:hypothetical protein
MKLKYVAIFIVVTFLCASSCYAEKSESLQLIKEGAADYSSVPAKSVSETTASNKAVANVITAKNDVIELTSTAIQKQMDENGYVKFEQPVYIKEQVTIGNLDVSANKYTPKDTTGSTLNAVSKPSADQYGTIKEGSGIENIPVPPAGYQGNKVIAGPQSVISKNPVTPVPDDGKFLEGSHNVPLISVADLQTEISKNPEHPVPDGDKFTPSVRDMPPSRSNAAIESTVTVTESGELTDKADAKKSEARIREAGQRMIRQRIEEKRKDMVKALEGPEDKESK